MNGEKLKEIISKDISCNKSQRVTKSYLKIFRKLQWYSKENKNTEHLYIKLCLRQYTNI